MSAYICSEETLGVLVKALVERRPSGSSYLYIEGEEPVPRETAQENWKDYFQILSVENALSVNHRYEATQPTCQVDTLELVTPTKKSWRNYRDLNPIQIIKVAHCYRYQACEHDGWLASKARRIIDTIIDDQIHRIPGYSDGPWGV